MKKLLLLLLMFLPLIPSQSEVPVLQLYVEGGTYDYESESWVMNNVNPGDKVRIWAIGNLSAVVSRSRIQDVSLAIAYHEPQNSIQPTFNLASSTTENIGGVTDSSIPDEVLAPARTVIDGSTPQMSDGRYLPDRGVYGPGIHWQEFALGDFHLQDSPMADFTGKFPLPEDLMASKGQINVYEVTVRDLSGWVHFDLYDSVESRNALVLLFPSSVAATYYFEEFDDDDDDDDKKKVVPTPEPATSLALLAMGIGSSAAYFVRKRKQPKA